MYLYSVCRIVDVIFVEKYNLESYTVIISYQSNSSFL